VRQRDISGEFSKRITEDFAISLLNYTFSSDRSDRSGSQWIRTSRPRSISGVRPVTNSDVGRPQVEWGGTGSANIGAESFNVYTPTLYFGKGWAICRTRCLLRPVAITARSAMRFRQERDDDIRHRPDTGDQTIDTEFNPASQLGATIQYSMPY